VPRGVASTAGGGQFRRMASLLLVATPIGNLSDLSERAKNALREADVIACEDTRVSAKLLNLLGVKKPLLANHEHNERQLAATLADRVAGGETVALVCDAGTPPFSDPGFRAVRECRRRGLTVTPIPGPFAGIVALSASGLPTNAFRFVGFLAPKSAARLRFLETLREADETVVLYESCHRIEKFAAEIFDVLGGERVVCVARELTKLHETFLVGTAGEVVKQLKGDNLRGEFVVIIAPKNYVL
jgi:16S rRNA (cytidine1402-2'-O)-methyltransferase